MVRTAFSRKETTEGGRERRQAAVAASSQVAAPAVIAHQSGSGSQSGQGGSQVGQAGPQEITPYSLSDALVSAGICRRELEP